MRIIYVAAILLALAACTSSKLENEWKAPGVSGAPYSRVMVIATAKSYENRVLYEDTVAGLLRSGGTEVLVSHEHFDKGVQMNRANIVPVVKRENVDGVVSSFLLAEAEFEGYQHANTMSREFYFDRYQRAMDYAYSPGFNSSEDRIYLSTSFFDVASGKEIWSAISETSNPKRDSSIIKSAAPVMVEKLRKQGLVR